MPTAFNALLMYFSMVIAQSFLARTFGAYTMQLFGGDESGRMVPILGVSLILVVFLINLSGNRLIQGVASFIAILKIVGILIFGIVGVWFTVAIAIMATAGGLLASVFAVSRMPAMLTGMKLVPHSHFGMPGSIQKHTLVYTVVLGLFLTAFFDLSRIAALGIVFYLIMDIAIHWGVIRYLREDIEASA